MRMSLVYVMSDFGVELYGLGLGGKAIHIIDDRSSIIDPRQMCNVAAFEMTVDSKSIHLIC